MKFAGSRVATKMATNLIVQSRKNRQMDFQADTHTKGKIVVVHKRRLTYFHTLDY